MIVKINVRPEKLSLLHHVVEGEFFKKKTETRTTGEVRLVKILRSKMNGDNYLVEIEIAESYCPDHGTNNMVSSDMIQKIFDIIGVFPR